MAAKHKPYEQFGPYILFKKLEIDSLGDLWRAARIDGTTLSGPIALRRLTGGNREAITAAIGTARQVAPLLTGSSFARDQVIDVINGVPFVANDYAGGRSLRHIVDRARGGNGVGSNSIPIDQALVIAEKVALSLATICELRFAGERLSHGALVPQFVWISDDGEIRIAGQQLGRGIIGSIKEKNAADLARYFSPEYQHSGESTKASEVYSLGAILYLVITGHEPPDAMSTSAFAAAIRAAKTMAGTTIPDDIHAILVKSLNLDPGARFATVADMKQALSALTSSGKYSATTFNLAFYLSNLLKKEFEGEAAEREKESKVNVASYVEALSAPAAGVARPMFGEIASSAKLKSKAPIAIAATVALAVIGAGGYFALGSKKARATAEPPKVVSVVTPAAPVRQPVIPEPILASPAPQTPTIAGTTATTRGADEAAQKKAFENAVKERLHQEMMKLQADYTKQLQKQQARNAPVPVAIPVTPAPAPTATQPEIQSRVAEERSSEPSAAQLDLQRQRETQRPVETVAQQQVPASTTQAPPPVIQQQPSAPAIPQIHEGDVVDVTQVDVVPRRTRDPRVSYPPMALRQRIETNVLTTVLISEKGDVMEIKVLRGDDRFGFTDAAVRALRGAHYSPAMKDGKRVKTWLPQIIQFKP
ncbi:MAG TPA: TonB family protein [Thermoanaerobaculia bacterium]|jgi:TonB family protein|nr:TonB family protein [Thermoanaerobaculia bacterium]